MSGISRPTALQTSDLGAGIATGTLRMWPSADANHNPWELFSLLYARKWQILAIVAVFVAAGFVYLWITPPIYSADVLLRVKKDQSFMRVLLDKPMPEAPERSAGNEDVRILRSRAVLGKVVDALDLTVRARPVYFPAIGEAVARRHGERGPLAAPPLGLEDYAWGGERLEIETMQVPDPWLGATLTVVARGDGKFSLLDADGGHLADGTVGARLFVPVENEESALLQVGELRAHPGTRFSLEKRSRLDAVESLQRKLRVESSEKQPGIVEVSLNGPDPARIARIVNAIASVYQELTVTWESSEADQRLQFLEHQLPVLKKRLESSEDGLNEFRRDHGAVDLNLEAEALLGRLVELETQLVNLRQARQELLERFTPLHYEVQEIDARISVVTGTIASIDARVKSMPDKQQALLRLSRDVRVDTELYVSLLNSAQEQRIARAGNIGNVRIVDQAVLPENPQFPRPALVLGLAGITGLFAALAKVLLRNSLRRTVVDPAAVERQLGLPVYAAIPHSKRQSHIARLARSRRLGHRVLARLCPTDESVESLRSLRATIANGLLESGSNVLMVCSPSAGMGKSFVCANLAALLASPGNPVLLIDADLRKGRLHELFGLPREPGLTDIASGRRAKSSSPIHATPIERLYLLPGGRAVDDPGDVLIADRLDRIIRSLRQHFRYIVIDSTPILEVADAAVVGRLSSTAIMVLKPGTHTLAEIAWSIKRLEQAGVHPEGLLFNDVSSPLAYASYGSYLQPT